MGSGAVHRVELGRDIDDAAPAALHHAAGDAARQSIAGEVIGRDDVFDDVVADLPEMLHCRPAIARRIDVGEGQPGIVDQDIDPAEPILRRSDHAIAFLGMAQIGNQRVHAASQRRPGNLAGDFGDIRLDMADREHPAAFAR